METSPFLLSKAPNQLPARLEPPASQLCQGRAAWHLYTDGVFPIQLVRDKLCETPAICSVTCSCPQARLRGAAGPPPAPQAGLLGLPPCRWITKPMWERDRGWGFGSQGQTRVWPTFAMASPSSICGVCIPSGTHTPAVPQILGIIIG